MPVSPGNKYPRAFITVLFGTGVQSPLTAPQVILVAGYRAVVGPSIGLGQDLLPYPLPSVEDAIYWFGGGSEVHQGAEAVLDEVPDASVWGVSWPEAGGGAYNEQTLTITNAAGLGGALTLFVQGVPIEVTVDAGMTANQQATAVYNTISQYKNLPCYIPAAPGANTVVFRWKHKGARGNQFKLRYQVTGITVSTYAIAQTNAGATDSDPQAAIDAVQARLFKWICSGADVNSATVGINRFVQAVNERADPLISKRGMTVAAYQGSYANAVTLSQSQNAHRLAFLWARNAEDQTIRLASRFAAAISRGTASDPTANINFLKLKNVHGPLLETDRIKETEATQALNNGINSLRFNDQGQAYVPRTITNRSQDVNGNPDYRTLDIGKVLMPDYMADFFDADIPVSFAGFKLRDDDPNDQGSPMDKVMTPKLFKSYMAGILFEEQSRNRLVRVAETVNGVSGSSGLLQVYIHPALPSRLVVDCPLNIINILAQIDMTLRQQS